MTAKTELISKLTALQEDLIDSIEAIWRLIRLMDDEQRRADMAQFRRRMTDAFDKSETTALIFDFDARGEVSGETLVELHANLIAYAERRGRLSELAAMVKSLRPQIDWPCCD